MKVDFGVVIMALFFYIIFASYIEYAQTRQESLERITMRFIDLAEAGKVTQEDVEEFKKVLDLE